MKKLASALMFTIFGVTSLAAQTSVSGTGIQIGGGSGGTAPTFKTNGSNNTTQSLLNFTNPATFNGLTFTFSNPSGGVETFTIGGSLANTGLATQTANTVLGALTATTPSGLPMPSCSGSTNALTWTTGTGFGCNTISGGGTPGGTSGQLQYNNAGAFGGFTMSGDGTIVPSTGVVTITKSNGTPFGTAAFLTAGTTGSDLLQLSGGLVPVANLPLATSGAFGAIKPDNTTITISGGVLTAVAGGGGFPITLGSTSVAASSTTTSLAGLTVDSVTPTIFGYLTTLTSNVQTQLNGKATSGANSNITSLSGLTTALSPPQGGTGGSGTGYAYGNGGSNFTYSTTVPGSAVSGNIPDNAANLSGTPTLPNGTAAATQTANDNSTKIATTAYVNSPGNISPTGITLTGSGPSTIGLPPTTYSILNSTYPCASNVGRIANVSDSTTQVWGAVYTGGGSLFAGVVCDGSAYSVFSK